MGKYVNVGAPIRRDGKIVARRGEVFEPTEDELIRKAYKLRPVSSDGRNRHSAPVPTPTPTEPSAIDLEDYHTGYGWYYIGGRKIQGKDNAIAALEELNGAQD